MNDATNVEANQFIVVTEGAVTRRAALDIMPGKCPNILHLGSKDAHPPRNPDSMAGGLVTVVVLGVSDLDVLHLVGVHATYRLAHELEVGRDLALLAALLTALTSWLVWSALSGMEVPLFIALSFPLKT